MRNSSLLTLILILTFSLIHAIARENIRTGERSGIPERADVEEAMEENGKKQKKEGKKEVRQNQENTDPVFYDSTTSPQEMDSEGEKYVSESMHGIVRKT